MLVKKFKKEVLIIKSKYETKVNEYEIKGTTAYIKLLKKDLSVIDTKIDADDLKKVLDKGVWFAEWNKTFNNYLVQNLTYSKVDGKTLKEKQTLSSFILDVHVKTPIRHLNGDTLDNRRCNLEVFDQNAVINDYEKLDDNSISIILRDKYGRENGRTIIDKEDLNKAINNDYTWVSYRINDETYAVANSPEGRIYLHRFIMDADYDVSVNHIGFNTLDNRKSNLKIPKTLEESNV